MQIKKREYADTGGYYPWSPFQLEIVMRDYAQLMQILLNLSIQMILRWWSLLELVELVEFEVQQHKIPPSA